MTGRRAWMAAFQVAVIAATAACSPAPPPGPPSAAPPAAGQPAATTGSSRSSAHAAGLFVVDSRTLGPIVIDGQGFVLYRSDGDRAGPACVDACAATWLPVPAADDLRVVGIDRQLVGQVARPDGRRQLTLAGWPLYGYAGDRVPGETNGQRRDGQWFVIAPDGGRAGEPAGPAA